MSIIYVVLLVGLAVAIFALLHTVAQAEMQATTVESGGFKFKVKNGTIMQVLDNLNDGYYFNTTTRVVDDKNGRGPRRVKGILEHLFGIFWISVYYPTIRVHEFSVTADKIKPRDVIEEKKLSVRNWVDTKKKKTTYLRFRFQHPVSVLDIDLVADKWRVDLIIMLDIMVIDPVAYVFDYKGSILEQVDAAVVIAVTDFFRSIIDPTTNKTKDLAYGDFVAIPKGRESDLAKAILKLKEDLVQRFGVSIEAAWTQAEGLSPEDHEEQQAAKAKAKATHLADAAVEKARGEKALAKAPISAMKEGLSELADSLRDKVEKGDLAQILVQQARFGNLKDTKLETLVEGNSNIKPTVEVNRREPGRTERHGR